MIVDNVPGMISAAPTPVSTRHPMSMLGRAAERRGGAGDAEDGDADDERAAAAEPVAERAGREQQRGQRDGVAVDDPLLVSLDDAPSAAVSDGTATVIIDTPATTSTRASNMVASTAVRRPGEIGSGSSACGALIRVWDIGTSRGAGAPGETGNGAFRN